MKRFWLFAFGAIIALLLASLAFKNVPAVLAVTVSYFLLIFIPGFLWVYPLNQGFVKTFLLANLVGFASGLLYVILDVVFRISLNRITFTLVPIVVAGTAILYWRRHYFLREKELS